MSKPYDATLNLLIDTRPQDWVELLAPWVGLNPGPAEMIDTDLSVTAQADKVFRLIGPAPALIHLELEANPRLGIPADLLRYNVLVGHIHDLPVHSILVLLRPKANASDLTGIYRRAGLEFRYTVIRVWQEPIERFLTGGPAAAALAMLTNTAATDPSAVFSRLVERLRHPDVSDKVRDEVLAATYVLCGLRYSESQVVELYRGVSMLLEDSATYQQILNKGLSQGLAQGRAEGVEHARRMLLIQGRKRFAEVTEDVEASLRQITDMARLERMAERIFDAANWHDLLATP